MEPPYAGPYEVVRRVSDRVFIVRINGEERAISTASLKPAFVVEEDPEMVGPPPPFSLPPARPAPPSSWPARAPLRLALPGRQPGPSPSLEQRTDQLPGSSLLPAQPPEPSLLPVQPPESSPLLDQQPGSSRLPDQRPESSLPPDQQPGSSLLPVPQSEPLSLPDPRPEVRPEPRPTSPPGKQPALPLASKLRPQALPFMPSRARPAIISRPAQSASGARNVTFSIPPPSSEPSGGGVDVATSPPPRQGAPPIGQPQASKPGRRKQRLEARRCVEAIASKLRHATDTLENLYKASAKFRTTCSAVEFCTPG